MAESYDIVDRIYDKDEELQQFLVMWEQRGPETRRASPENKLLFDPENELKIDGGLRDFIDGQNALKVGDNPRTVVAQAGNEYSFIISVDGDIVETTPKDAERVLEATYKALSGRGASQLVSLHSKMMEDRVRKELMETLARTFRERSRIDITPEGWLIDGLYLVDWSAKLYAETGDDRSFEVSGGDAVRRDKTHEFVSLSQSVGTDDPPNITIDGTERALTEREALFLGKVKWLLYRRYYHPDKEFWMFADRWADVDEKSGMPSASEGPNLDQFDV